MFVDQVKIYVKAATVVTEWLRIVVRSMYQKVAQQVATVVKVQMLFLLLRKRLRTLMDFRYQRHFKADRGQHGMSKGQHGRKSEDLLVKVPPGTVVKDEKLVKFLRI